MSMPGASPAVTRLVGLRPEPAGSLGDTATIPSAFPSSDGQEARKCNPTKENDYEGSRLDGLGHSAILFDLFERPDRRRRRARLTAARPRLTIAGHGARDTGSGSATNPSFRTEAPRRTGATVPAQTTVLRPALHGEDAGAWSFYREPYGIGRAWA